MKWLSYWALRLRGWSFEGEVPPVPKMIIIGAPHTSNWDFALFLGALHHFDLKVRYLGKAELFRAPFGWLFRRWGGIPVDRTKPGGVVGQTRAVFDATDEMVLVIAPEGTRSRAGEWKSGFIKIAQAAEVPVVLAAVDGPTKTVTIGPSLEVGDGFMEEVREFYRTHHGFRPELKGPIRTKGETLRS